MDEHENGSNEANGSNGFGEPASKPRRKRVLVKDVTSRVEALENRLAEVCDELLKLDERMQKMVDSIAQEQANRWTAN
jgi:chaperonin cofactor prefoldin